MNQINSFPVETCNKVKGAKSFKKNVTVERSGGGGWGVENSDGAAQEASIHWGSLLI